MTVRRHAVASLSSGRRRRLGAAPGAADARHPQASGPDLPRHRRHGVVERHRHGRTEPLHHRPRPRRLRRLRGRHEAGDHLLQQDQPADRLVAPARHQRQHGAAHVHGAGRGRRLRQAAAAAGPGPGRRLRHPGRGAAGLHRRHRRARNRHQGHPGRRLDVDVQRALHLAQGAGEDQGEERGRRARAAPSSCSRTARTPRAW